MAIFVIDNDFCLWYCGVRSAMSDSGDKPSVSAPAPRGSWGSLLAAPRLISTPSTSQLPSQTGSVLRPAQLKTSSNPFAKFTASHGGSNVKDKKTDNIKSSDTSEDKLSIDCAASESEKKAEPAKEVVPKFLPLHSTAESKSLSSGTSVPTAPAESVSTNTNFVFGQNLQERIVKNKDESNGENSKNHVDHSATNGSSDLLFSSAVKASADGQSSFNKDDSSTLDQNSKSWSWVSESPAPAILPAGPIITGEEDEDNILQINCRLFAFEEGHWKERGRGQLRLNDSEHGSRLVCRSAGSLRVLLNTKVWGDMTVDIAGTKSLRVTATDPQQHVKVFLIMARPDEIVRLSKFLNMRVAKAKLKEDLKSDCKESSSTAEFKLIDGSCNDNSSSSQPDSVIEGREVSNCADSNESETNNIKNDNNPLVIVSHDGDDEGLLGKRSLETDDEQVRSKKLCAEQTDNQVPL